MLLVCPLEAVVYISPVSLSHKGRQAGKTILLCVSPCKWQRCYTIEIPDTYAFWKLLTSCVQPTWGRTGMWRNQWSSVINYFNWNIYFMAFNKTPLYFGLFDKKSRRLLLSSKVSFHSHFQRQLGSTSLSMKSLLYWTWYQIHKRVGEWGGFKRIGQKERWKE